MNQPNYCTTGSEIQNGILHNEDKSVILQKIGGQTYKLWESPPQTAISCVADGFVDGVAPCYRTGDFFSNGENGFELHQNDSSKTSFWSPSPARPVPVKIATSGQAQEINIITGQLQGVAKPYIAVQQGQYHASVISSIVGEIFLALDAGKQFILFVPGYDGQAVVKTSLFNFCDVDLQVSFFLDCQGNIRDVKLDFAGLWYGAELMSSLEYDPSIENWADLLPPPTQLIGISDNVGIFVFGSRNSGAIYTRNFNYADKFWENKIQHLMPIAANETSRLMGNAQISINSSGVGYLVFEQLSVNSYNRYYSLGLRKYNNSVWETSVVAYSFTGAYGPDSLYGSCFNNNNFGAVLYWDRTTKFLNAVIYQNNVFSSAAEIVARQVLARYFICVESNNDRVFFIYYDNYFQLNAAVFSGGSWIVSQIDAATGNKPSSNLRSVAFSMVDNQQKALVAWTQKPAGEKYRFYTRFYDSGGWGSAYVHDAPADSTSFLPVGCCYNGTNAAAFFRSASQIYFSYFNGSAWSSCVSIVSATITSPAYWPFPCHVDTSHNVYVVYEKSGNVYVGYYDGSSWVHTQLNTAGINSRNVLLVGEDDVVLVSWEEESQDYSETAGYDIYSLIGAQGSYTSKNRISRASNAATREDLIYGFETKMKNGRLGLLCLAFGKYQVDPPPFPETWDYYYNATMCNTGKYIE